MMKYIHECIRVEWILLRRSPVWRSIPILHAVIWLWFMVRYELGGDGQGARSYYFYEKWMHFMPIAVLLTGMFSIYILYKDRNSGMDKLLRTWPQSSSSVMIGKWLLAQFYGLSFTIPTVVLQGIWMGLRGNHEEPLMLFLSYTFVQMGAAIFMIVSLGMLIGALIRNKSSFVLLVMVWIVPVIVHLYSQSNTSSIHVISRWFAPYDMTRFRFNPVTDSWGLWGVNWTTIHQIFVALLGLLSLGLACLLAFQGRTVTEERKKLFVYSAVMFISVISIGWISYDEFMSRVNQYVDDGRLYMVKDENALKKDGLAVIHSDFQTTEMKIKLLLSKPNRIQVESELEIVQTEKDHASTFHLTLNRQLFVTDLQGDQPLEWNRNGDVLEIRTATPIGKGEAVRMNLNYSGTIDTYRSEGVKQYSGISKEYVLLPKSIAWYPQIGQRQLSVSLEHNNTTLGFLLRDSLDYREPGVTRYHLSIEGRSENMVIPLPVMNRDLNEYSGDNSNGLYIYQGVTEERRVNGVQIIDHPDVIGYSVNHLQHQLDQMEYLNSWLNLKQQTADLYSGYIFYGEKLNHLTLAKDSFSTRFPRENVKLPAIEPMLLNGLLSWVYEREYPEKWREWNPSFKVYYLNYLTYSGPTRALTPVEDQFVTKVDQISVDRWDCILTISSQLYTRYLAVEATKNFNPLQELEQIISTVDEVHPND